MKPLPVTVIGGYLGAGKTSLVNHLLRHAQGRRLMVLVNDFGDLAIDADLLESAEEDTLTLTNGCVCCTMGADLMYALGDALDRRPRPDVLVIEASGVAQPEKIAAAAVAEPEMRLSGVVVMADAANLAATVDDPLIGAQVADQLRAADLVGLTKLDLGADPRARVAALTEAPVVEAPHGALPPALALDPGEVAKPASDTGHAAYAAWSYAGPAASEEGALRALLEAPPPGLYRLKGRVRTVDGGLEVHVAGRAVDVREIDAPVETRVVAIGPKPAFDPGAMEVAWKAIVGGDAPR